MIYIYIVLYLHSDFIFQLNINTLDIKILYNLRGFTVQVIYICQSYLSFHAVVLKTIAVDYETTGVDFCTSDRFLSSDFALCSFAIYPDKVAKDELLSVPAQPLSCIIVQYRALSCKIAHYFRKSAKIIGLFFGRYREML